MIARLTRGRRVPINSSYNFTPIQIDSSTLLGYFNARAGITPAPSGTTGTLTAAGSKIKPVPTPPWDVSSGAPRSNDLVKRVLAGKSFFDTNAAQLDVKGASDDYKKLFALYQGLNALSGLAEQAAAKGVGPTQLTSLQRAFSAGLTQASTYLDKLTLDQVRITQGRQMILDQTVAGIPKTDPTYLTQVIYQGAQDGLPEALQGDVKFDISIKRVNTTFDIAVDLSEMGATARTLPNVVNYINGKLEAAGVFTRIAVDHQVGQPRTVTVGKSTITLPAGADQWRLKIKGDDSEALTLSAPSTAGAVYLAQTAGVPPPTTPSTTTPAPAPQVQQLLKFQTDQSLTGTPPPAPLALPGQSFAPSNQVSSQTLGKEVAAVHATAMGADGSRYVLADVTGATAGQTLQGPQDVALMKYDSAGNLLYTRVLGATGTASGMALAVSADGKVAVAGKVTGAIDPGESGLDANASDSFVTLYDASGQEVWTQRRAALQDDQAAAVAFGSDGSVYVAGKAKSAMPGATAVGGWDGYLQGFGADGTAQFSTQFGTTGDDKATALAVDGSSVIVGGVDGANAVLRRFDLQVSGAPTLAATRDLGSLGGGGVASVAVDGSSVIVAGTAGSATLSAGTVTSAFSGGATDGFAATLSSDLQVSGSDALVYFGGAGNDSVTAMTVSNGGVWIAGTSTDDIAGLPKVGTQAGAQDGYVARLDIASGTTSWAQRFSAQDGQAAPTSIAVDPTGASVLDRLGLPTGTLTYDDSQLITAQTAARAGDQIMLKTREGGAAVAVTLAADDTLDTLAQKINRALGFQGNAAVVSDGNYRRLKITPLNDRSSIEILAGAAGKDMLNALGLKAGVVDTQPAGAKKTFGLNLDLNLSIATSGAANAANKSLQDAITFVRAAYSSLKTASQPPPPANASINGPVPTYLTNQIANYQAALRRLTGGG
jgi:hypothetical protein